MSQPAIYFLILPAVIFLAYIIFGISGFGASLFSIPLLSQVLPLDFLLPLCLMLDFLAAMTMGTAFGHQVDKMEIRRLVPYVLVGTLIGVTLLIHLPRQISLLCLATFITVYGAYSLLAKGAVRTISPKWSLPAGLMGGMAGALFGIGGPPYVMYLTRRIADKSMLRASIARMATLNAAFRLCAFLVSGLLFQKALWVASGLLMPLALCGLWIGHKAHLRLKGPHFARLIHLLLVISGISLLARAIS